MSKKRKSLKRVKVTITLPEHLRDAIDELADIVQGSRSEVIQIFADYCLKYEGIIDELFPLEEEETEEETD